MKYHLIIFIIFVSQSFVVSSSTHDNYQANFEYYDDHTSEWYNFTISDKYFISSTDDFYNGLELPKGINPWDRINNIIQTIDFYNINQDQVEEPHVILHIKQGSLENTIFLPNMSFPFDGTLQPEYIIVDHFSHILNQLLGSIDHVYSIWAYDYSMFVMESYPEQYGFETYLVRGLDWLDVVYEPEVSLIVSDYNFMANYLVDPNGTILHKETKKIDLDYGGQVKQVDFTTFSVPVEFRPEQLYFTVMIDNEFAFMISPNGEEVLIQTPNVDVDDLPVLDAPSDNSSDKLELPFDGLIISLTIISIPILKRRFI